MLGPKELNKCILREMVKISTLDEVRDELMGKSYFTLSDLRKGFYHCELKNDFKRLCAFNISYSIAVSIFEITFWVD